MLTSMLDAFVASGRVVEFEPNRRGDEDRPTTPPRRCTTSIGGSPVIADPRLGEGGLLEKIGVVKSCVERKKKRVEACITRR
jgi:hypothetical protein